MDDALALELFGEESSGKTVLILVVMDDALALLLTVFQLERNYWS